MRKLVSRSTGPSTLAALSLLLAALTLLLAGAALPGCSSEGLPQSVLEQIEQEQARRSAPGGGNGQGQSAEASPSDRASQAFASTRLSLRSPIFRPVEEWSLQETAEHALGRMGEAAVPYLVAKLRFTDPDPQRQAEIRRRAAEILAQIGPAADAAVPDLIRALNDESPLVRKSAAFALGQIGPDASEAVPDLVQILLEPTPQSDSTDPEGDQ